MEPEQYVELFAVNYDLSEELADDIVKALRQTRSERHTDLSQQLYTERTLTTELLNALRNIEHHHVEQNRLKGRDESHSTTLRIARAAIAKATRS